MGDWCNWRHPEGPQSSLNDRRDHPVVHVAYEDAVTYAAWRNCRLPTEAEWEYAARSKGRDVRYPWGNESPLVGDVKCNIWDGVFRQSITPWMGMWALHRS